MRKEPFKTFKLKIVSAKQEIFTGVVQSCDVSGSEGEFGILAGHMPMLATIKPGSVHYRLENGEEHFVYVSGGFIEVHPEEISILADVAIRGEELDEKRILSAKKSTEEQMHITNNADLTAKLAREIAKLKVYQLTTRKR